MSTERATEYLAAQAVLPDWEAGRWHGYAVERRDDGRVVGDVGAFLQAEGNEGDLGFQFHPSVHGRGVAFEAASALLDCLLRSLVRVTAHCDARNVPSFRLMERLGMRRMEESDEGFGYALTRDEWRASGNRDF